MNEEALERIRGSADIDRGLDTADPGFRRLQATRAAEIIKTLDTDASRLRTAQRLAGIDAAGFARSLPDREA